jgi:hypothetical protein
VGAAEDLSVGFHAVPHNPAVAVRANRRQRMDSALEAIEGVVLPANDYFKRFVIFVFANFACSHTQILLSSKKEQICFRQTQGDLISNVPSIARLWCTEPNAIETTVIIAQ